MPVLDLRCFRCRRQPYEIEEYIDAGAVEGQTPAEYVLESEGTLNRTNGHFVCTECYIEIGMPSSPQGWRAP